MTAPALLAIGELAAATGVTVSALRHWDGQGVISFVERVGGKRRFLGSAVGRVIFVSRAQRCGFSLAEIRDILDDTSGPTRQMVDRKIAALRDRRAELATMIATLEEVKACGCRVVAWASLWPTDRRRCVIVSWPWHMEKFPPTRCWHQ